MAFNTIHYEKFVAKNAYWRSVGHESEYFYENIFEVILDGAKWIFGAFYDPATEGGTAQLRATIGLGIFSQAIARRRLRS